MRLFKDGEIPRTLKLFLFTAKTMNTWPEQISFAVFYILFLSFFLFCCIFFNFLIFLVLYFLIFFIVFLFFVLFCFLFGSLGFCKTRLTL